MSFKGKVVVVTGGSSGIGAAIAISFAKNEANVVIVGRNETKLKNVEEKCGGHGGKCLVVKADVSNDVEAALIVENTIKEFGRLDVLVNNAGIIGSAGILSENAMEVHDHIMNTNLRAVVLITHKAAPYLVKSKGNIINISSVASLKTPQHAVYFSYSTSKAALDHFTRCVAAELAPKGVRVNVVNPGLVRTDIFENGGLPADELEGFWEKALDHMMLGRVGEPEDIAEMVLFLASDKAKGVTGSSFVNDNGMLLKR